RLRDVRQLDLARLQVVDVEHQALVRAARGASRQERRDERETCGPHDATFFARAGPATIAVADEGSNTAHTSWMRVAGKPLSSACCRIRASSRARYTQNV